MTKFVDKKVAKFKTFKEYQESDEYNESKKEMIVKNPEMKEYFIVAALCAYWRDQHLYSLTKSEQKKWIENEDKIAANNNNKLDRDSKGGVLETVETYSPEEHLEKFGDMEVKDPESGEKIFEILDAEEEKDEIDEEK